MWFLWIFVLSSNSAQAAVDEALPTEHVMAVSCDADCAEDDEAIITASCMPSGVDFPSSRGWRCWKWYCLCGTQQAFDRCRLQQAYQSDSCDRQYKTIASAAQADSVFCDEVIVRPKRYLGTKRSRAKAGIMYAIAALVF